ncbi:hypothetical protein A3K55_02105 [Candidatus Shapirobacteria bacterium RBG_13_44_7]|uniref:Uncharacterized protein n=1 Tax=Candidatus Shapirobacteria bacterium RBG_13_44_7 TaxID=1802149 RepID=A0A1F7SGH5_9BACT|nr:MAG: hypothetical protein A3K55_02105 [Candidatus Shapirobacteria bacterium RBG_13_44_7]
MAGGKKGKEELRIHYGDLVRMRVMQKDLGTGKIRPEKELVKAVVFGPTGDGGDLGSVTLIMRKRLNGEAPEIAVRGARFEGEVAHVRRRYKDFEKHEPGAVELSRPNVFEVIGYRLRRKGAG